MIEVKLSNGSKHLVIINNRVLKYLASVKVDVMDSGNADDADGENKADNKILDALEDVETIEKIAYLGYVEGCRYKDILPIDEKLFCPLLSQKAIIQVQEAFIGQLLEVGEYLASKKKVTKNQNED
jgi:hypothetical protein